MSLNYFSRVSAFELRATNDISGPIWQHRALLTRKLTGTKTRMARVPLPFRVFASRRWSVHFDSSVEKGKRKFSFHLDEPIFLKFYFSIDFSFLAIFITVNRITLSPPSPPLFPPPKPLLARNNVFNPFTFHRICSKFNRVHLESFRNANRRRRLTRPPLSGTKPFFRRSVSIDPPNFSSEPRR